MNLKKRKKTSRIRGSRTFGWGFRQRHRGKGCKGGKGMSGSGKRADQKKQFALNIGEGNYFGKRGFTSRSTAKKKNYVINLSDIQRKFEGQKEINLKNYKILGNGEGLKVTIVAKSASKVAIEKVEKAGGKIVLAGVAEVKK
ncbi:MAG: uL15 family ribosomal protein [Nanoarchaeota archaeon]